MGTDGQGDRDDTASAAPTVPRRRRRMLRGVGLSVAMVLLLAPAMLAITVRLRNGRTLRTSRAYHPCPRG